MISLGLRFTVALAVTVAVLVSATAVPLNLLAVADNVTALDKLAVANLFFVAEVVCVNALVKLAFNVFFLSPMAVNAKLLFKVVATRLAVLRALKLLKAFDCNAALADWPFPINAVCVNAVDKAMTNPTVFVAVADNAVLVNACRSAPSM